LAGSGLARSQTQCDRTQVKETGVIDAVLILVTAMMSNSLTAACKSLVSVLNELTSRGEASGKKSKRDKPFDQNKADVNVAKALADPKIRGRIEKIHADVVDDAARLVYEVAILDEQGYHDARELKLRQLQQRVYRPPRYYRRSIRRGGISSRMPWLPWLAHATAY
jgi:hypothetical protein